MADKKVDLSEASTFKRFIYFLTTDHRFVFLGTSALCASALVCSFSYFGAAAGALSFVSRILCVAWIVFSLVAGVRKLTGWDTYATEAVYVKEPLRTYIRIASYVAWAAAAVLFFDVLYGYFSYAFNLALNTTKNPMEFVPSAIYMINGSKGILLRGIETTIALAIFGTILAFLLALILVFLRIQKPDRGDNYLVRFFKSLGCGFARLYITIIRGTPMMVQGLIIYYSGFSLVRSFGFSVGQTQEIWSFFTAGLVTLSLCSAAYMTEVLRASIEAIDPGQLEASRSLGLTQWQGMRSIVFPQGVRNAIPAISNEFIINIKDSSVLSVIGVFDLMYATTTVTGTYFRQMEMYIATAIVYLVLTFVAGKILDAISHKMGMKATSKMLTINDNPAMTQEMMSGE